jgi:hypothetical protein
MGLLAAAGCGAATDHGDRAPVAGTVTVKGKPLDVAATLYFDPPKGQDGIGAAAEVADGKFTIPADMGPTPGKQYKVKLITAPGIPAPGTPPAQIRRSEQYVTTVDVPARGDKPAELTIDFQ